MNILVIPHSYPSDERPHITTFIREHTVALKNAGYNLAVLNVDVLSLRRWIHKNTFRPTKYSMDGIDVYYMAMQYIRNQQRINTWSFQRKLNCLFSKYKEEFGKPDIIISHFSQYAGYCAMKIAKKNKIPLLAIEHAGWLLSNDVNKFELKKLKEVVAASDAFVCVSDALKASIDNKTGLNRKTMVIPNMISNIYRYKPLVEKEKFSFFSAGNLYAVKRIDLVVAAFCEAFSVDSGVTLRIAGQGNEYQRIKSLIDNNGRENQIVLLGSIGQEQMLEEYTNADAFVLPSQHETFGIAYREAMAVGRPIITTKHQGFQGHLWKDFYGIQIDIDSKEQLVNAMKYMVENHSEYDPLKISKDIVEKYSIDTVIGEYNRLIKRYK